jgi:tetratricopeptide (TPR) repeat protein
MSNVILDEELAMKQEAEVLRSRGKYDDALDLLREIIDRLKAKCANFAHDESACRDICAELADTYGMIGGVYRRKQDLPAALAAYQAGREEEKKDESSTYNLGNVIMLKIMLEQASPQATDLKQEIETVIGRLERQTTGARSDEWWAWADLGQFHLLNGDLDAARRAYEQGRRTGPTGAEYRRHIDVLGGLAKELNEREPTFAAQLASFIEELQSSYK